MKNTARQTVAPIDSARTRVLGQFATALETQNRSTIFAETVHALIRDVHTRIAETLATQARGDNRFGIEMLAEQIARQCHNLDETLAVLFKTQREQSGIAHALSKSILLEFDRTIDDLSNSLTSKELMEKQRKVLETIILSHERITKWDAFVEQILTDLNAIFPFDFFFIAFSEQNGVSLHTYFMGNYRTEIKHFVRKSLAPRLENEWRFPAASKPRMTEHQLSNHRTSCHADDVSLITASVPEYNPSRSGLVGVAYGRASAISPQETTILQSLLSVMLMIIGCSKALSKSLGDLEYYSLHDPLTRLHNRRYFNELLHYEIGRSERHRQAFSVLMLDLDNFKDVNDSYGHGCGDSVLREVAKILRRSLRKGDTATRLGGDEFAIILPDTPRTGAERVAETIVDLFHGTSFADGEGGRFKLTTSIGIASYPQNADNFADLMSGVDIALYSAKHRGKDGFCWLDATAEHRIQANRAIRASAERLKKALSEDRICPYFQPIVDCATGEIFAHEALARLREKNGEIVAAGAFIEAMEKYGLCLEMERIIIRKSMLAKREQVTAKAESPLLFINLSPQDIQEHGILTYAEEVCATHGISPSGIVFEITEHDAIRDMTNMRTFLSNLRDKGFAFALDDFGSGYNSFHYLRELHFEYVKIDGAFVRNILHSRVDYHLVENLCRLCQCLGIRTIAEYVESAALLEALREMGVDYAQGYHLGTPMPTMLDRLEISAQ